VYRIHGTNQPSTIATFVSSGCIRLTNEDVTDLYSRVMVGTRVVVLPGRPPATATATSLAPLPRMPPGNGSIQAPPPGQPHADGTMNNVAHSGTHACGVLRPQASVRVGNARRGMF
jgi:hypothetical protein